MKRQDKKRPMTLAAGTALLLLAACGEAKDDQGAAGNGGALASAGQALTFKDLPTCAAVAAAVGAPLAEMALLPEEKPAAWQDEDQFGLTCSWGNQQINRAASGEALGPAEIAQMGTINLQIMVSDNALTRESAKAAGMLFADPQADAVGAWVLAKPDLDRSAPLKIVAPNVMAGNVSVAFASSGAWLNTPDNLANITQGWAIDSALTVHQMLRGPRRG